MPTIKEMKNKWPHIGFEEKCIGCTDALIISSNSKFVCIPFDDECINLSIDDFKIRILNPILSAIETKIKQEEIRKKQNA